jgi:hypothetical protein
MCPATIALINSSPKDNAASIASSHRRHTRRREYKMKQFWGRRVTARPGRTPGE